MELIVKAKDIFLEYAGRDILDIEELEIYSYDRIGLVGDNGAGKTSLLKILSGNLTIADADVRRFGSIALIGQLDELDLDAAQGSGEMLSRLNVAGVAQETMSGGEETRAKIASALSQHASAIFADEPTSHLDQDGISLLVGQLKAFDGALLIVSHDRYFLDQVVDKIWELKDGGISEFWGDYSDYLRQKEEERKVQAARYEGSVGNVGVMALPVWHEEAVLDPELLPLSYADSIPSASSRLASIALRAVSLSSASLSGVGGRDGFLSFESSAILSSEK